MQIGQGNTRPGAAALSRILSRMGNGCTQATGYPPVGH
jgi:hypothetical protein